MDFLIKKYIDPPLLNDIKNLNAINLDFPKFNNKSELILIANKTIKGNLEIEQSHSNSIDVKLGSRAFINDKPAFNGKYKLDFMWYIHIRDGIVSQISVF